MENYYLEHADSYYNKTVGLDPSFYLAPFVSYLPENARILDVGCGSGRDLLWLKKMGFSGTGFDFSLPLVQLARRHTGCSIIHADFETFDFSGLSFDAILLSGALVHLSHDRLHRVFTGIIQGLSGPMGYVYLSLKKGDGQYTDAHGRHFFLWQEDRVRACLGSPGLRILQTCETPSVLTREDVWMNFVILVETP